MPLYEYECEACGAHFEKIRKFSDPPLEVCDKCGKGPVKKLLSSPAFQFKGSGWYVTDYGKGGGGKDSKETKDSKEQSKDSAAKTEAKTETKTETKTESTTKSE